MWSKAYLRILISLNAKIFILTQPDSVILLCSEQEILAYLISIAKSQPGANNLGKLITKISLIKSASAYFFFAGIKSFLKVLRVFLIKASLS